MVRGREKIAVCLFKICFCYRHIWRKEETHLLSPSWTNKYDPSFPPVEELLGKGNPIIYDLQPGGKFLVIIVLEFH